ncbi:hypothetical protein [Agromyces arachidis]|uniref:hypothetical protein n=1 Tax=Agromyces arachidis TaxID=766966 RepID=UPI004056717E
MPDEADQWRKERIAVLRLILEVADRFDEYVAILRSAEDRSDAEVLVAKAFGCTEADARGIVLQLSVQRLTIPFYVERMREELAELGA